MSSVVRWASCLCFSIVFLFATPSLAQDSPPPLDGKPIVQRVSQPYILSGFEDGAVIDLALVKFEAEQPMSSVIIIDGTKNPDHLGQTFNVTIRIGSVDGRQKAQDGVYAYGVVDSTINVGRIALVSKSGFHAKNTPTIGFFNNFLKIGSIARCGQYGLFLDSPPHGPIAVQGNHIEVGQIRENGSDAVHLSGASNWNSLVVGPIEKNGGVGCYQPPDVTGNAWTVLFSNGNASTTQLYYQTNNTTTRC